MQKSNFVDSIELHSPSGLVTFKKGDHISLQHVAGIADVNLAATLSGASRDAHGYLQFVGIEAEPNERLRALSAEMDDFRRAHPLPRRIWSWATRSLAIDTTPEPEPEPDVRPCGISGAGGPIIFAGHWFEGEVQYGRITHRDPKPENMP